MTLVSVCIAAVLAAVVLAGCGPKLITVTSGEKIVCTKCGKTIRSDVRTRKVDESEASHYSVCEVKEICPECEAKVEAERRRAAEHAERERKIAEERAERERRMAEAQAEKQRRADRRNRMAGIWKGNGFGCVVTIVLNKDGTGILDDGLGGSFRITWSIDRDNLIIKDRSGAVVRCPINDDDRSFAYDGRTVFTRS